MTKKFLSRVGDALYYANKGNLIQYLKAWVSILQEEETTTQPVQTPAIEPQKVIEKTVYVSVPTSITEQSKELILS